MPDTVLPIVLTVLFMAFFVFWAQFYSRRLEPWMRERIGQMLGFPIEYPRTYHRRGWSAPRDAPPGSGCIVTFWEFVVGFGCGVAPIFLALTIMVLILMAVSGG